MKKHSGMFSKENQPSQEARAASGKTRSIKLRSSIALSELSLKDVFSERELKKLHATYKTRFHTLEALGDARAEQIIAYNILRYITQHNSVAATENALRVLKHLDVMSYNDLKETINPIFHFDKYESEI